VVAVLVERVLDRDGVFVDDATQNLLVSRPPDVSIA
jgi:hypothetical protein